MNFLLSFVFIHVPDKNASTIQLKIQYLTQNSYALFETIYSIVVTFLLTFQRLRRYVIQFIDDH